MSVYSIITALADGQQHHVTELSRLANCKPFQLNALWQQAPQHIRGLLRQRDGMWHLVRPIVWLPENYTSLFFNSQVLLETTSSNDILLADIRESISIHQRCVIALSQTQGRGQQGRVWENRSGECLMFSLGWSFQQEQAQLGALSAVVALACQRALANLHCPVMIKWPNDLVYGLKKLGGILIETVRKDGQTHAVIGIGLNIVLPKMVENAISFQTIVQQKYTVETLLNALLQELFQTLSQFSEQGFLPFQAAYQAVHRDQDCDVYLLQNGQIVNEGKVQGVDNDGALLLSTANGLQKVMSGETSLRLPEQVLQKQALPLPPQHYLLFDAGNSRLKWAWIEGEEIVRTGQAPYRDLSGLQTEWQLYGHRIHRIVGSAVCSEMKRILVAESIGQPVEWLPSMPKALGLINHYRYPDEHGADRWFNALGSCRFSQYARIIVSCGTAVTIDAITADQHYLGGTIMPGFYLMRESLAQRTARLQRSEGMRYPFPTTTANAIATGMMDAVCGSLILMHTRLKERSKGERVDVMITGGGAAKVATALPEQFHLDNVVKIVDNLVIYGLLDYINQSHKYS